MKNMTIHWHWLGTEECREINFILEMAEIHVFGFEQPNNTILYIRTRYKDGKPKGVYEWVTYRNAHELHKRMRRDRDELAVDELAD